MSTFEVKVYPLKITEHTNADKLEIAHIGDYQSIVPKGKYKDGDAGAYIPESSMVPDSLIKEMGLEGKLAGKAKNRVKAVIICEVLSQGLIYGPLDVSKIGMDVQEELGITKYEPPTPVRMEGKVWNASMQRTVNYDIENIKKYPDVLKEGEEVVITEKLHGVWCCIGYCGDVPIVSSRGLSSKGLALKLYEKDNTHNLYCKVFHEYYDLLQSIHETNKQFYVLGEVFGKGVQDLHYGTDKPAFRVFDIFVGSPMFNDEGKPQGEFLDIEEVVNGNDEFCLFPTVPLLYRGPYSKEVLLEHTNGKSYYADHIREGVVVKAFPDRYEDYNRFGRPPFGRVIFKSVSEDYLLRKGGTELE